MLIYGLYNLDGELFYIGCTRCSLEKRLKEHKIDSLRENWPLYKYIRAIGRNNIDIMLLDEVDTVKEMFNTEQYYINIAKLYSKIYNVTISKPVNKWAEKWRQGLC